MGRGETTPALCQLARHQNTRRGGVTGSTWLRPGGCLSPRVLPPPGLFPFCCLSVGDDRPLGTVELHGDKEHLPSQEPPSWAATRDRRLSF